MSIRLPISIGGEPQRMSHYPAIPPPAQMPLVLLNHHPCPYSPDRTAQVRAFQAAHVSGESYHELMDAGFRRSGQLFYQPVCAGCRRCVQLRVPVSRFRMSKSQRRVWRRNGDVRVIVGVPELTEEKTDLYRRYLAARHDGQQDSSSDGLQSFLYESSVDTVEFSYRVGGRLVAVGICDVCALSLSSVYFFFDPSAPRRSLGVYGTLRELEFCRVQGIEHYYLGYWVSDARSMRYKAQYRPNQLLGGDGVWRDGGHETGTDGENQ